MSANIFGAFDWNAILPMTVVAITALVVLAVDLIIPRGANRPVAVSITVVGLALAGIVLARQFAAHAFGAAFIDGFMLGGFGISFSLIIVVAAMLSAILLLSQPDDTKAAAACSLMLWSATGAMLMAGAANLMTIFLGLELLSLALYCLCGIVPGLTAPDNAATDRKRAAARESALKYLILSSMASGFLLYGMALLFGATGSISLAALATITAPNPFFAMGCGLFLIGLAFKLGLVPFHIWTPDVFEGAPLPVTAFMSIVTKAGALAVLARFIYGAIGSNHPELLWPLWVVAALSMIVGNLAALAQTDMKRLLAYSGIAQLGYIVAALAGGTSFGVRYAIFYLGAYTFMNLGAFAVVALLSRDSEEGSRMSSFAGLGQRRPLLAAAMTFFLLALAGLPPTAGFTGKILILASSVDAGFAWLAGVLVLGTAISIYVYVKVIRAMYAPVDLARVPSVKPRSIAPWIGVALCAVAVIVLGLYPIAPHDVLPLVK